MQRPASYDFFAQLERLLPSVRKPGRYVGGEYNRVIKDWEATSLHVCLAFPDIYDLGMSNLGLAILYDILNAQPDILAERVFLPWVDMIAALRRAGLPLYSLETYRPLSQFDIIGFTLPYELIYTNVLEMLALAGLPVRAAERDQRHPLIIAGGHAAFNPEPMADFIDAFVIGDGEEVIVELARTYQQVKNEPREQQLRALASISGVYVPRFYRFHYRADGLIEAIEPCIPEAPLPVRRRIVGRLPPPPTRLLVPMVDVAHNRATIEIQRGCSRGCRFCQAGIVTRPVRERPITEILTAAEAILRNTGFEELGLLSLSSSDYSGIEELVQALVERFRDRHVALSLPALRADSFSVHLAEAVGQGRHSGFTFAPEAATEHLRAVINKPIETEQVLQVAREVVARGWRTLKLYFMIGLPGETAEDVQAIADIAHAVRAIGRAQHGRHAQIHLSVNTFVPKPHTPLQWSRLASEAEIAEKQALLRRHLGRPGFKLDLSAPLATLLEAVCARGDRRLGAVIERAWRQGARFDAWDEQRAPIAWWRAFTDSNLDPTFYAHRERDPDEKLPWDVIDVGVDRRFLLAEYRRSQEGGLLADCRTQCYACGISAAYAEMQTEQWRCALPAQRYSPNAQ